MRELDEIKFRHVFQHDGTKEIRFIFANLSEIARGDSPRIDNTIRWDWLGSDEYTGMKDMNGREIYEGDIMNHLGLYGPNFVVDYDRGIYHLIYPGLPEHNNFYADLHKMLIHHAVIGNIYENPELVQVKQ